MAEHNPTQQRYQVHLQGQLDEDWGAWFGGVTVTPQGDGTTMLTCNMVDQATLHGVLRQIRDLGMPLISVNRIDS